VSEDVRKSLPNYLEKLIMRKNSVDPSDLE